MPSSEQHLLCAHALHHIEQLLHMGLATWLWKGHGVCMGMVCVWGVCTSMGNAQG